MKKQVCVVGMGRFGSIVANELYQSGHDVLAIDLDESRIQQQLGRVTYAVRADATSETVLRELDIPDYDVVIVALGSDNIQASVGMTVLLKSMGVPMIIARAANDLHGETLERIGAIASSSPKRRTPAGLPASSLRENSLTICRSLPTTESARSGHPKAC